MNLIGRQSLLMFCVPTVALFIVFFLLPLFTVVDESLTGNGRAYSAFLDDPVFWKGLWGTLLLGTAAPSFSMVVGLLVCLYIAKLKPSTRTSLLFVISLPLTFSGLIVAYGFILVFGRAGFVTMILAEMGANPATLAGFIYSPLGLGFTYSYYLIPRVVLVVLPVILNFRFEEIAAARSLGASNVRAHWDILLPQILPSLVAAFCLTSAVAVGAYGTALALVGTQVNILPLVLYSKISETGSDFPAAAAMSVILMGICCLVVAIAEIAVGRSKQAQ